ncbi:hypothetical protein Ahy_B10g102534 [Arachis hypogaea]|uniref:Uncharacterized protein n=1 Tax=Arachis hypogaea TaxID=3818 RepID=A0A444X247_ARAHY|nr:hypothetical protein Ahy_B10g102534 [Arachis hypogaea]
MDENSHDDALDEYEMLTKVTDTSAAQARKGKDIQGIQWDRLNISRDSYRVTRLEQYKNYENILASGDAINELRNLVWATSKHDVYLISNYSVMHWSSLSGDLLEIINFAGHVALSEVMKSLTQLCSIFMIFSFSCIYINSFVLYTMYPLVLKKHAGSLLEGFSQTQISTLFRLLQPVVCGRCLTSYISSYCFLEESRQLMRLPPWQSTAEADLMTFPIDVSRANTSANGSSGASSEMSLDGWDGLALEYSVDWPLHLFLTQEVLSKSAVVLKTAGKHEANRVSLIWRWFSNCVPRNFDFVVVIPAMLETAAKPNSGAHIHGGSICRRPLILRRFKTAANQEENRRYSVPPL